MFSHAQNKTLTFLYCTCTVFRLKKLNHYMNNITCNKINIVLIIPMYIFLM